MNLRKILFAIAIALFWATCFAIYIYIEWDFQKGYQERREQQKIEHNFYQTYKDSIK